MADTPKSGGKAYSPAATAYSGAKKAVGVAKKVAEYITPVGVITRTAPVVQAGIKKATPAIKAGISKIAKEGKAIGNLVKEKDYNLDPLVGAAKMAGKTVSTIKKTDKAIKGRVKQVEKKIAETRPVKGLQKEKQRIKSAYKEASK